MERPVTGEFNPYFSRYINLVPEGSFYDLLRQNTEEVQSRFESIPKGKENFAYATSKWTVNQMLLHMTDTERVMSFWALLASRGDREAECPNMDQDLFALNAEINGRDLAQLLDEFLTVRKSTVYLFENISAEKSKWRVNVAGHSVSPRALGYIIIGHAIHHLRILETRYL
ncbi:MAG TPA: DinB family protein [Flavitalea sp.]|nr:DinB family protein [Flavitalea sp.]